MAHRVRSLALWAKGCEFKSWQTHEHYPKNEMFAFAEIGGVVVILIWISFKWSCGESSLSLSNTNWTAEWGLAKLYLWIPQAAESWLCLLRHCIHWPSSQWPPLPWWSPVSPSMFLCSHLTTVLWVHDRLSPPLSSKQRTDRKPTINGTSHCGQ